MNWDDFKYVLAVSRARSFLGAAKLLRVSHTTVSRRITALESDLDVRLFDRNDKSCAPTMACRRIIDTAIQMESVVHSVGQTLREVGDAPEGAIQVTTQPWIISRFLIPAFPRFMSEFPGVQVFFVGDVFDHAAYDGVPRISLRFDQKPGKKAMAHALAHFGYAVYAPAGQGAEDLQWVSFNGGPIALAPSDWLNEQGVPQHEVPLLANDASLVREAIRTGVGKGLIPECLGAEDPLLDRVSGGDAELDRTLCAIIEPEVLALPRTRAVMQWLRTVFPEPAETEQQDGLCRPRSVEMSD